MKSAFTVALPLCLMTIALPAAAGGLLDELAAGVARAVRDQVDPIPDLQPMDHPNGSKPDRRRRDASGRPLGSCDIPPEQRTFQEDSDCLSDQHSAKLKAKEAQEFPPRFTHTPAAGMPDCTDPEVHKLAIQAMYRDLRKLGLLDGPDAEMERGIRAFQNSTSRRAQMIYRSLPASYGMDESHLQVCEPSVGMVPFAVIFLNPQNTRQWGLSVGDIGVPNMAADIRLEFLQGR